MRRSIIVLLALSLPALASAAPPPPISIDWQKCIGGTNNDELDVNIHQVVEAAADGSGFYMGGTTLSSDGDLANSTTHGAEDILVRKCNSLGDPLWQRTIGGSSVDLLRALKATSDGGCLVVATTRSTDGDLAGTTCEGDPTHAVRSATSSDDGLLVKFDRNGNREWMKVYGSNPVASPDYLYAVVQNPDGSYVVAGSSNSDFRGYTPPSGLNFGGRDVWVMHLDASGGILQQALIGGLGDDDANGITLTGSDLVTAGSTQSVWSNGPGGAAKPDRDILVIGLDSNLAQQWTKVLVGNGDEAAYSVIQNDQGNFVFAGTTNSTTGDVTVAPTHPGSNDFLVFELDGATHQLAWSTPLGGTGGEGARSVIQTDQGSYLAVGVTNSSDGDVTPICPGENGWVVSLHKDAGNKAPRLLWQRAVGGSGGDQLHSVAPFQGGYLMLGTTHSPDGCGDVSGFHGGTGDDLLLLKLTIRRGPGH